MHVRTFEIPRPRKLARHAWPHFLEATLIPLGLFYAAMWLLGVWGALGAALLWSYGAIGIRILRRHRISGLLMLGVLGLTVRTVIAAATGSVFIYFLQPTLGTVAVAFVFLASAAVRKPMVERLAADFCPFTREFAGHPHVKQFFLRVSLLWALVFLSNAAMTIWMLLSQPVATYLLAKTGVSLGFTLMGILVSVVWFKRSMRRGGVIVRMAAA